MLGAAADSKSEFESRGGGVESVESDDLVRSAKVEREVYAKMCALAADGEGCVIGREVRTMREGRTRTIWGGFFLGSFAGMVVVVELVAVDWEEVRRLGAMDTSVFVVRRRALTLDGGSRDTV